MAKNFDAQIQVKDKNSISTLQKIIKETEKLKKDMASIGSKPIQIKAKEDSSMKKVQDDIKKLSNTRINPIQLKVNDGLTPLMNKLEGSIGNTFRQINNQVAALTPKLVALNAGTIGAGAGILSGAAAGSLLNRSRATGRLSGNSNIASFTLGDKGENLSNKWIQNASNALNTVARKVPSLMGPLADAFTKSSPFMKAGTVEPMSSWFSMMIDKQKTKIKELDDAYTRMTGKMRKPFLPQFKQVQIPIGPDDYEEGIQRIGGVTAFDKLSAKASAVASKIKSIFSVVGSHISYAFSKVGSVFSSIGSRATSVFGSLRTAITSSSAWNSFQSGGLRALYAVQRTGYRAMYGLATPIAGVARGFLRIPTIGGAAFTRVAAIGRSAFGALPAIVRGPLGLAFAGITRLGGAAFRGLKGIAGATLAVIKGLFGSLASGAASLIRCGIGGAFTAVFAAAKLGAAALIAGIGVGIHGLAQQESNSVSMNHFIKNGNPNMSATDVKAQSEGYMKNLTQLGNETPFENPDIYTAGRRAIQVSDGNTSDAFELTKLSADMAALNPGKTVQDAMEAMADLKNGETERMKEFGFKISQDDLKQMVRGSTGGDSLTSDETAKAFKMLTSGDGKIGKTFKGGAAELSGTISGKWSTFTGTMGQMWVDAMKPFQDQIKGAIDMATNLLTGTLAPALQGTFGKVAQFMGDLGTGNLANFPIIDNLINSFNILKDASAPIIDKLVEQFDKISSSAEGSFGGLGGIIEGAATVIGDVIKGLTPVLDLLSPAFDAIKNTVVAVWPVVQGIITVGSQVIYDAVSWLSPIFSAVGSVMQSIGNIIAEVWPSIQATIMNVWANLQPVFELISSLAQGIADVFAWAWPGIADVIKGLWSVIGSILENVSKALGDIASGAKWAFDKLTEFGNWVTGNGDKIDKAKETNDINPPTGDGEDGKPHAYGLSRVPYNGYKAVLHEGERVLTAREARQQDSNGSNGLTALSVPITIHDARDPEKTVKIMVSELQKVLGNFSPA